ncbi:MAG: LacI family DNA-binding transcriptional regulator [Clostridia bacterium]|nr:LacI family DNA-binding transcriptional regulator [Clostridia bacterium]
MALLILCDPTFKNSAWCERKIKGIRDEASRRRTTVKIFTSVDTFEAVAAKLDGDSSVIVLFSKISYIQSVADVLSRLKIHPIIANSTLNIKLPFSYSSVSTDIEEDVRIAIEYLYSCQKTQIALLGVDENSWGDLGMAQMFERYAPNLKQNIYYAKGDMESCFSDYLATVDKVDAVMLPNDHLAICFVEFLKERNAYRKDLFVIGRGDSISARLYGNGITSITTDFYNGGRALAELHFNRLKYGWKNANIKLKSKLVVRGSTDNIPYIRATTPLRAADISNQVEPALFQIPTNSIGRIDTLLATSELTDLKLIYGMICGFSYERIGEFCFLSSEAVKYRVRKIRNALLGDTKADATEIISKYIHKENLLSTIEELEGKRNNMFK